MDFRKILSLTAVLLSTVVVIATSQRQFYMDRGDFDVKTDCTTPVFETVITVQQYQVVAPSGVTYNTLGFPTLLVVPGQDSIGTGGGVTRVCRTTYSNEFQGDWIFSCFDNENLACTIYMKQR